MLMVSGFFSFLIILNESELLHNLGIGCISGCGTERERKLF